MWFESVIIVRARSSAVSVSAGHRSLVSTCTSSCRKLWSEEFEAGMKEGEGGEEVGKRRHVRSKEARRKGGPAGGLS